MGFEYFNQALVFPPVLFKAFQLVAAGTECAGWSVAQPADCCSGILPGIDQVFSKRADDPVAASVNLAYLSLVLARRFDNPSGRGIDDGGDAAGLSIKSIFCCHVSPLII